MEVEEQCWTAASLNTRVVFVILPLFSRGRFVLLVELVLTWHYHENLFLHAGGGGWNKSTLFSVSRKTQGLTA